MHPTPTLTVTTQPSWTATPPFPTVADAWPLARHYATKQELILYALANVAEHPDSDLIYDWRRQYSADAEPDLTDPARALAYLLEHTLNHSPDTDAQPFIILLHHRLGASDPAPAWDEPPQYPPPPPPAVYSFDIDDTIDLGDGYPPITFTQTHKLKSYSSKAT